MAEFSSKSQVTAVDQLDILFRLVKNDEKDDPFEKLRIFSDLPSSKGNQEQYHNFNQYLIKDAFASFGFEYAVKENKNNKIAIKWVDCKRTAEAFEQLGAHHKNTEKFTDRQVENISELITMICSGFDEEELTESRKEEIKSSVERIDIMLKEASLDKHKDFLKFGVLADACKDDLIDQYQLYVSSSLDPHGSREFTPIYELSYEDHQALWSEKLQIYESAYGVSPGADFTRHLKREISYECRIAFADLKMNQVRESLLGENQDDNKWEPYYLLLLETQDKIKTSFTNEQHILDLQIEAIYKLTGLVGDSLDLSADLADFRRQDLGNNRLNIPFAGKRAFDGHQFSSIFQIGEDEYRDFAEARKPDIIDSSLSDAATNLSTGYYQYLLQRVTYHRNEWMRYCAIYGGVLKQIGISIKADNAEPVVEGNIHHMDNQSLKGFTLLPVEASLFRSENLKAFMEKAPTEITWSGMDLRETAEKLSLLLAVGIMKRVEYHRPHISFDFLRHLSQVNDPITSSKPEIFAPLMPFWLAEPETLPILYRIAKSGKFLHDPRLGEYFSQGPLLWHRSRTPEELEKCWQDVYETLDNASDLVKSNKDREYLNIVIMKCANICRSLSHMLEQREPEINHVSHLDSWQLQQVINIFRENSTLLERLAQFSNPTTI